MTEQSTREAELFAIVSEQLRKDAKFYGVVGVIELVVGVGLLLLPLASMLPESWAENAEGLLIWVKIGGGILVVASAFLLNAFRTMRDPETTTLVQVIREEPEDIDELVMGPEGFVMQRKSRPNQMLKCSWTDENRESIKEWLDHWCPDAPRKEMTREEIKESLKKE
jgi:hypothetical protein